MSIFKNLSVKDYIFIVICVGLVVAQVWLDLLMPEYLEVVINEATNPSPSMSEIWVNGGIMLACAIGSALLAILTGYFASRIAAGFSKRLRSSVFDKVQGFSSEEIHKFSTASLITRSTNDITQIQMTIAMGLQVILRAPILAIWAICKIVNTNWQWTTATAITVGIIAVGVLIIFLYSLPKFRRIQKQTDDVNDVMRENLRGIRVVRAYNAENYQEEKFAKVNDNLTKTNLSVNRAMTFMSPLMLLCMSGLTLAIYVIACFVFNDSTLLERSNVLGSMMEFSSYAIQVVMAFMLLIIVFIMLPRAITAGKRINEVLNTPSSIHDGTVTATDEKNKGLVEFDHVSFKYPNAEKYVLKDINLKINKGETVAFIGSTGSGKSTLINLIPRFYDVTEGSVKVDGVDVRDYKLSALHDKLGYVSQKAVLFSGTVNSNVAYGEKTEYLSNSEVGETDSAEQNKTLLASSTMHENLTENNKKLIKNSENSQKIDKNPTKSTELDENSTKNAVVARPYEFTPEIIQSAVEVAQAKDFVEKMENTYDATIEQGGTNLSGGQKQRISIARAIARDPEIYIFDDSFSALDYKTDAVLRAELKKYTRDATILIVAQRIGTIKNADKIVVLENGETVGIGTHEELLKSCPVYQEIALSQLSKEELANE